MREQGRGRRRWPVHDGGGHLLPESMAGVRRPDHARLRPGGESQRRRVVQRLHTNGRPSNPTTPAPPRLFEQLLMQMPLELSGVRWLMCIGMTWHWGALSRRSSGRRSWSRPPAAVSNPRAGPPTAGARRGSSGTATTLVQHGRRTPQCHADDRAARSGDGTGHIYTSEAGLPYSRHASDARGPPAGALGSTVAELLRWSWPSTPPAEVVELEQSLGAVVEAFGRLRHWWSWAAGAWREFCWWLQDILYRARSGRGARGGPWRCTHLRGRGESGDCFEPVLVNSSPWTCILVRDRGS